MNQFGQSNTNDLQKAIDEITGGSASAGVSDGSAPVTDVGAAVDGNAPVPEAPAADVATELEDKIKGQMGVPPVPPTSGEGVPEMAIPGMQASEGVSQAPTEVVAGAPMEAVVDGNVPAPEAPVETTNVDGGVAAAPEATAEGQISPEMGGDLAKVRESALQELIPLMDKVEISADERFNIYAEVIETTRDKSIVEKAFEAARGIADEKQKAESLLRLVKMIDTL